MTDANDVDELRRKTERGDRLGEGAEEDDDVDLTGEIRDVLEEQEDKSVSVWDAPTSAYVDVLRERPAEMAAVAAGLGIDEPEEAGRSDIIRQALRNGFKEADSDRWQCVRDAAMDFDGL